MTVDPRTLEEKDYDDQFLPGWGDALWHWSSKKNTWTRLERKRDERGRPLAVDREGRLRR